jgi:hypothetical protein
MAAAAPDYLNEQISSQQAQHASVTDTHKWLTRYIFVPFRDRGLSLLQQSTLGIVGEIKAGYIIPFTRRQQWIIDYDEVKRVPTYSDGSYHPSSQGVSSMKPTDRAPSRVVDAILRIFNVEHGKPVEDNGICEVEVLRGIDDMELLRDLNGYCLPERFDKARLQVAQLERAVANAPTQIHREVAEQLLSSTLQSVTWANWHYANLEADMEDRQKTGKDRLSPLDRAVCAWIERQPPKFRTNLTSDMQAVTGQTVAPAAPTVQHSRCGGFLNLVNGKPPEFCHVCNHPFYPNQIVKNAVEVEEGVTEIGSELEMTFSSNNPMAETEAEKKQRLADEQRRAKEALKNKINNR